MKVGLLAFGNAFWTLFFSDSLSFNKWGSLIALTKNSEILLHNWVYCPFWENLIETCDSGESHINQVKGTYPFVSFGIIIVLFGMLGLLINKNMVSNFVSL